MVSPRFQRQLLIGTHPGPPPLPPAHVSPAGAPLSRTPYLNSHPPPGGERAGATSGSSGGSFVQGGTRGTAQAAISATGGTVELDPGLKLNPKSSATPVRATNLVRRVIPVARVGSAVHGQNTILSLHGRPRASAALAISLPPVRRAVAFPGLGDFWLDATSMVILAARPLDANGVLAVSVSVPAATPLGISFAVQSVTDLSGTAALSTPVVVTVR